MATATCNRDINTQTRREAPITGINPADHPCFNRAARREYGRVHLPVAPQCNIKCKYCNRLFDCPNEGRPGVTSRVLDPEDALRYLEKAMAATRISVAGIAGPGDPLANPNRTLRTLALVKERHPGLLRCLSTNGLEVMSFIDEVIELASHVTLTVNAVDSQVGARIYGLIMLEKRFYFGREAADILRERQMEAIRRLKQAGMIVKVNTVVIPGVNDHHIPRIAEAMSRLSVDMFNAIPLFPVAGTPFGGIPEPSPPDMRRHRHLAGKLLPQMTHCARCRADAAGLIGEDLSVSRIEAGCRS